ncbi:polysaccharide export outer membrane protein [Pasteurella testudinis DSM 23072]|uniref:Polysaccharide export outer membrane protein n=1 Tax=Pasteurella testudinis DSM 23072 TaxID=1122938 RepID=A0A1W1VA50_9PAST|nr:polysaccharide biosynthesis/export family protein [Pasteurella testudinis]SMB89844.1 polysaccharide export outer membrane protein [Pasteurella testudinis DSM 23072]SUB52103.1 protein HexD [Pasteurella testudinis]
MKKISPILMGCLLTACNIMPTSGPSQSRVMDLHNQGHENIPTVEVVEVEDMVATALFNQQQAQSFSHFANANSYNGAVNVGDTLDVMIWEAPPAVLFGSVLNQNGTGGAQLTSLPEQMVSESGKITIPFLGAIAVRGKTPEQIQKEIVRRLSPMANQPQAMVRLVKNNSANVTVLRQGNSIRMPLTAHGERVLDAVAAVGGATENAYDISVQLTRGHEVKTISLEKLASNPNENIKLRSGDVISLLNNPLSFTALGAVGSNREVRFSAKGLTLAEAIGRMGGLIDTRSDPRGVFVFRYLPFEKLSAQDKATWQGRGYGVGMEVPTVYRINLLEPKSLFWLQRFPIQNKDIVYVSNAPLAEFQKFLRIIFSITSPVTSTANSVNNLSD